MGCGASQPVDNPGRPNQVAYGGQQGYAQYSPPPPGYAPQYAQPGYGPPPPGYQQQPYGGQGGYQQGGYQQGGYQQGGYNQRDNDGGMMGGAGGMLLAGGAGLAGGLLLADAMDGGVIDDGDGGLW